MGTPKFVVGWAELWIAWGSPLYLASEVEALLWVEPLACEVCANSGQGGIPIELKCRIPSWRWRIRELLLENDVILHRRFQEKTLEGSGGARSYRCLVE